MRKLKEHYNALKKVMVPAVCVVEILLMSGGIVACTANNSSTKQQITMEKAEELALSDAGITASDVISIKTKQDMNNGVSVYDIEFYAEDVKYEYEIKMETGSIYSKSKEIFSNKENAPKETNQDMSPAEGGQADKPQQNTEQQNTKQSAQEGKEQISIEDRSENISTNTQEGGKEQIGIEDAKNVALMDAGVSSSDVTYTKAKLDYEDGVAVYDIEFYIGSTEYEYEINAATGAVYSKDVETHHSGAGHGTNTQISGTYISDDSAKSIALNHAGFVAADVTRLKSEFDIDDGQAVYEVEFYKDSREYDYKINALDGTIIKYEVD